jgi:CBS domain-containing protein
MKASDIMTSPVITVAPETPVAEIAVLLAARRISAVPVLENARLVGLVSEADLLHRHELGTDAGPHGARPRWLRLFSVERAAADYTRSHAVQARDVMTREVHTVDVETAVPQLVALMDKRGVKRVPVLRGAELVGIVSRADVVRALAAKRGASSALADDKAIRARLAAELARQPWWREPYSSVRVADGVVHYSGFVQSPEERDAARVAAQNVPGVRAVEDHRYFMSDIPAMV